MQIKNRQIFNIFCCCLCFSIFLFGFSSTTAAQTNSSLNGVWHFEDYQGGWLFQDNGGGAIYTASPNLATPMSYHIFDRDMVVFIIREASYEYKLYHIDLFTDSILMLHDFETLETLVLFRGAVPSPTSVKSGKDLFDSQWINGENTLEFFEDGQVNWGIDNPMTYTIDRTLEVKSGRYIFPFEFLHLDNNVMIFRRSDVLDRYVGYFSHIQADTDVAQLVGKWEEIKPQISGTVYDFAADGSVVLSTQAVKGTYTINGNDLIIQTDQNRDAHNNDLHLIIDYLDRTVMVFHDPDYKLLDSEGKPASRFVLVNQNSGIFCYTRCTE